MIAFIPEASYEPCNAADIIYRKELNHSRSEDLRLVCICISQDLNEGDADLHFWAEIGNRELVAVTSLDTPAIYMVLVSYDHAASPS
jgi:hypothetical protein